MRICLFLNRDVACLWSWIFVIWMVIWFLLLLGKAGRRCVNVAAVFRFSLGFFNSYALSDPSVSLLAHIVWKVPSSPLQGLLHVALRSLELNAGSL